MLSLCAGDFFTNDRAEGESFFWILSPDFWMLSQKYINNYSIICLVGDERDV